MDNSASVGDWFLNDFRGTTGFESDIENKIWGQDKKVWEKVQCLTYKPSIEEYVVISDSDGSHTYTMSEFFKHRHVFLPQQDQLQKMLIDTCTFGYLVEVPREFYFPDRICPDSDSEYPACPKCMDLGIQRRKEIESMEQLWLCIVIDEIYTKDWNGTEWVFNE